MRPGLRQHSPRTFESVCDHVPIVRCVGSVRQKARKSCFFQSPRFFKPGQNGWIGWMGWMDALWHWSCGEETGQRRWAGCRISLVSNCSIRGFSLITEWRTLRLTPLKGFCFWASVSVDLFEIDLAFLTPGTVQLS